MRKTFLAAICLALTFVAGLTACSNDDMPEVTSAKSTTQVAPGKFGMFRIVDADGTVLGEFPCNITTDTVAKTRAWDGTYLMPNTSIRILSDAKVGSGYRHIRAVQKRRSQRADRHSAACRCSGRRCSWISKSATAGWRWPYQTILRAVYGV